jgi:hypothetical protein
MANIKHADPMKTKTGKTRLGPLNLKQLTEMLEKESKAKNKSKIQSRIKILSKRLGIDVSKKTDAEQT